ncbi:hypothetical protein SRHO_G00064970 [Serrasalmus rhombeus]
MSNFLHNRSQNIPFGHVSTILTFGLWSAPQHLLCGFFTVKMCFVKIFVTGICVKKMFLCVNMEYIMSTDFSLSATVDLCLMLYC